MKPTTFAQCMDVFDWFDDDLYDFMYHNWVAKLDAKERIARVLPRLIEHAAELIAAHAGTEEAYPEEFLNQPA